MAWVMSSAYDIFPHAFLIFLVGSDLGACNCVCAHGTGDSHSGVSPFTVTGPWPFSPDSRLSCAGS